MLHALVGGHVLWHRRHRADNAGVEPEEKKRYRSREWG